MKAHPFSKARYILIPDLAAIHAIGESLLGTAVASPTPLLTPLATPLATP